MLWHERGVRDAAVLAAGLLHDTIEDTDTKPEELRKEFVPVEDAAIADIVLEVTDDKALPKAERKRLQVEHAGDISTPAQRVKLADKICNVRDVAGEPPKDWDLERRRAYFEWAREVVDGMRGANARLEAAFDEAYKAKP